MLKAWLKKIGITVLELAVIAGGLWYVAQKKGIRTFSEIAPALQRTMQSITPETPFPALEQPVIRKFDWEHKGVKYSLDETLYQSVYAYYQNKPKEYSYSGDLPANWENDYYAMFLKNNEADKTISNLTSQLRDLGKKHKLADDQIVDLTLAFVQAIPYDDAKAQNILARTGNETMRFPYEVLYEQQGVCSDKSLLAYLLLKEMGYGTALLAFEQDNHMAVAVQCPQNYSTYASGYCYAETTSTGNKIGIIPNIDIQSNKTVEIQQLSVYDASQDQQVELKKLSQATIILPTQGKVYSGIIQTEKTIKEIDSLKSSMEKLLLQIQAQKKTVNSEGNDLGDMKKDLEKYKNSGNIDKYNALVKKFNGLLETYKKDVKKYNDSVTLYNQDVQKYNTLIRQ